jgi:hypothetical protein
MQQCYYGAKLPAGQIPRPSVDRIARHRTILSQLNAAQIFIVFYVFQIHVVSLFTIRIKPALCTKSCSSMLSYVILSYLSSISRDSFYKTLHATKFRPY